MQVRVSREELERAARMYRQNTDASAALGIALGSFGRLCRRHGIETPYARAQRRQRRSRAEAGE